MLSGTSLKDRPSRAGTVCLLNRLLQPTSGLVAVLPHKGKQKCMKLQDSGVEVRSELT